MTDDEFETMLAKKSKERRDIALDDKLRGILCGVLGHDPATIRRALDPIIEAVRSTPTGETEPTAWRWKDPEHRDWHYRIAEPCDLKHREGIVMEPLFLATPGRRAEDANEYRPWEAEGIDELEYFKRRYLELSALVDDGGRKK